MRTYDTTTPAYEHAARLSRLAYEASKSDAPDAAQLASEAAQAFAGV